MPCLWLLLLLIAGCTAQREPRYLGSKDARVPVAEGRDAYLSVRFLPYDGVMEREAFDTNLSAARQLAAEVGFERLPQTDKLVLLAIRRHEVRLVLDDGTERYPVDPLKIYERHRGNPTGATVAFGLMGYLVATADDEARKAHLLDTAWSETTLSASAPRSDGLLFFDMNGIDAARVVALLVDYEDTVTSELRHLRIGVELPKSTSDSRATVPGRDQRKAMWDR